MMQLIKYRKAKKMIIQKDLNMITYNIGARNFKKTEKRKKEKRKEKFIYIDIPLDIDIGNWRMSMKKKTFYLHP